MQGNNKNETTPQYQQGGACAACKHQRKKCSVNCALAPYFPASRHREFEAVQKVFGVSNMSKLVKHVKEDHRRKVVESLIWEAFCRQQDPILGSYGHYRKVYDQYTNILQQLHHNNAVPKDHHHHQLLHHHHHHQLPLSPHHHQNHHWVMSGAERSSVDEDDGLGFIHNQKNSNNNMTMDSSSFYGLDFSHIDGFKSEVVTNQFRQHHHPPYYYSGQQFN